MSANATPAQARFAIIGLASRVSGDSFDASFFGCSPDQAAVLPPRDRLTLQCAWQALEDAGRVGECRRGCRIGVFAGFGTRAVPDDPPASTLSSTLRLFGAGVAAPTFCSSPLAAAHAACRSLAAGECDAALAGGAAMPAQHGHDAGGAFIVLRRLDDALRDGDQVYAVLLGSSTNEVDMIGGRAAVLAGALAQANVPAEADGSGEEHEAAGMAGLLHAVAALRRWRPRQQLSPSATPRRARVGSDGGGETAYVVLEEAPETPPAGEGRPWEVVLLSARTPAALDAMTDRLVTRLRQPAAPPLEDVAFTLQVGRRAFDHRRMVVGQSTADVASVLATRDPGRLVTREQAQRRRGVAFLCAGLGDQYVGMAYALYDRERAFRAAIDECADLTAPHLGLDLRDVIYPPSDRHDGRAQAGDVDLRAMLRRGVARDDHTPLSQTRVAQPAVFAVGYAMTCYLREWGIEPAAVIGHSLGEYIAATVAGVFSLADAIHVVCHRADLIDRLPKGAMLAVAASAHEVRALAADAVDLAAVNGERAVVIAGPADAVAETHARLAERGVPCRGMEMTHAFHSRMLIDAQRPLIDLLQSITLRPPAVPCVSNVSGTWLTPGEATDPRYWARHMCSTVRFADGLGCILEHSDAALLEVGPGQTLGSFAKQHPCAGRARVPSILSSIPLAQVRQSDFAFLQATLGKLWLAGVEIDWAGGRSGERRRLVSLPTYPFEAQADSPQETDRSRSGGGRSTELDACSEDARLEALE